MAKTTDRLPLLLHETARIWRSLLDKRFKPLGLSQAKWRALLHLSLANAPLTQTELASRLGIECASLVGLLDGMEKSGWITREDVPNDRRSKYVKLTDKTQDTLLHIHATANQLRDEILTVIPAAEIKQCMNTLQKIIDRAEAINNEDTN